MRRALSIVLFVLGGWMLLSEVIVSWIDMRLGVTAQLAAAGMMALFALPFFALGTWASPGNRRAELGLTLMITAGLATVVGLMAIMMFNDPTFVQALPPDQKMPDFAVAPVFGTLNFILIAGGGFLLRRWGLSGQRSKVSELETVFGD